MLRREAFLSLVLQGAVRQHSIRGAGRAPRKDHGEVWWLYVALNRTQLAAEGVSPGGVVRPVAVAAIRCRSDPGKSNHW